MIICTKIKDLDALLAREKLNAKIIGFVPTMGALHPGHISLIEKSRLSCDLSVCSIFVNPNQFNDKEDLKKYPRTPTQDIAMLEQAQCDVLFMPEVAEVYPKTDETQYQFGHLDTILEGAHRPGHFNGVAQVVRRLFEIVKPNKAFFGSKDYQQVMVVKDLVKQLQLNIEIIACPILRERDGLAMSSRNTLLNNEERLLATNIPLWMEQAKQIVKTEGIQKAKNFIAQKVQQFPLMKLDYFEVCNSENLMLLNDQSKVNSRIQLIALFIGKIRLIDNLEVDAA